MKHDTRLHRPFRLVEREPDVWQIHDPEDNQPWRTLTPEAEPEPIEPALTLRQIGNRVWLGILIGNAVMFAYDPHGAWLALTTAFSGGR